ncbi:MAG: hypothetical protein ACP5O0_02490 [Acidimicrobiales bacterium]
MSWADFEGATAELGSEVIDVHYFGLKELACQRARGVLLYLRHNRW